MIGWFRAPGPPLSVRYDANNYEAYITGEGGQYKSGVRYRTLAEWIDAGRPLCQRLPKDQSDNEDDKGE